MNAPTLDLRHFRYFVAVAEELHFGRAARRLHLAQPPLSQQIRQLEERLGVQLFVRSTRRVELTPAGRVFLDSARRALAEAASAVNVVQRAGRGELSTLRIGFTDSSALSVLPGALRRFRRAYPAVHLELVEGDSTAQLTALERDAIDVAVVAGPVSAPAMFAETVLRDRFAAVLPAGHPLARRTAIALSTLAAQPLILGPPHVAPAFQYAIRRMCLQAGFVPQIVQHAAEYQAILSLVAAGLGISIVPGFVRNLKRQGVVYRPLRGTTARAEIAVVHRAGATSEPLTSFRRCLRDEAR